MVESFENLDEMFEAMRERMDEADTKVESWQALIRPGEYFRRLNKLGFTIYGEILQEEEPREEHLRHYRLCRASSVACPYGEMGDIHVSTIDSIISKEEYEEAKSRGWR